MSIALENAREFMDRLLAQLPLILLGLIVFALFLLLARLVRAIVWRAFRRHDASLAQMLAALARVITTVLGVLLGFWIAIPTVQFTEIFASLGVTGLILGFALRDIIENFVAGILILWRRPFNVGDQIKSGSYEGTVVEINFRSTVLKTYDGIKVYIPNGKVFTEALENRTGYPERRATVTLGIDQNASVAQARQVILDALRRVDGVLLEPAPMVYFDEVAEFTNNLKVLFWTRPATRMSELTTASDVTEHLYGALRDAGIGFPYPIRTLQIEQMPSPSEPARDGRRQ